MRAIAALLLLGALAPLAWGAAPGSQRLEQGRAAFAAGDYTRALSHFRAALTAGLDSATLHYDLGATLYRLGRYSEARTQFRALRQTPAFAAIARYNLGLIALKQGRERSAREHFAAVRAHAEDARLRRLAARALARLPRKSEAAHGLFSLGAGYDDNASFAPEADLVGVSRRGDPFVELLAAARKPLTRPARLRLEGGVYVRDYRTVNRFDQVSLRAGVARLGTVGAWRSTAGAHGALVYLGGARLESVGSLSAQGRRAFGPRRLRLRYTLSRIEGADAYAYLTGWRHRLRAELRLPAGSGRLQLGYRLEANDRADLGAQRRILQPVADAQCAVRRAALAPGRGDAGQRVRAVAPQPLPGPGRAPAGRVHGEPDPPR